ncbi:hypothetical protein FRB99_001300 [Tulasnella sp. 403]|nr:hypothetical protein FRB99_001300 [Tulasnella sp. 403]
MLITLTVLLLLLLPAAHSHAIHMNHPRIQISPDNGDDDDKDDENNVDSPLPPGAFPDQSSPSPPPSVQIPTYAPPLQLRRSPPAALHVDIPAIPPPLPPFPNPDISHPNVSSSSPSPSPSATSTLPQPTDTPALELYDPLSTSSDTLVDTPMSDPVSHNGFDFAGDDMYFDDEGLGTLERIYLFARSRSVFHRVFISRSLPNFLPDVTPHEAVEYGQTQASTKSSSPSHALLLPTYPLPEESNCQIVDDGYYGLAASNPPPPNGPGDASHTTASSSEPLDSQPTYPLSSYSRKNSGQQLANSSQGGHMSSGAEVGFSQQTDNAQGLDRDPLHFAALPNSNEDVSSIAIAPSTTGLDMGPSDSEATAGVVNEGRVQSPEQTLGLSPEVGARLDFPSSDLPAGRATRSDRSANTTGTSEATSEIRSQPPYDAAQVANPPRLDSPGLLESSDAVHEPPTVSESPQAGAVNQLPLPAAHPPFLPVQVFTPLLGSLLLSANAVVGDAARAAVVELLRRLKDGFGLPSHALTDVQRLERQDRLSNAESLATSTSSNLGALDADTSLGHENALVESVAPFGLEERQMLEHELLVGVVIGMARLDQPEFGALGSTSAEGGAQPTPRSPGPNYGELGAVSGEGVVLDDIPTDNDARSAAQAQVSAGENACGSPGDVRTLAEVPSQSTPSSIASQPAEASPTEPDQEDEPVVEPRIAASPSQVASPLLDRPTVVSPPSPPPLHDDRPSEDVLSSPQVDWTLSGPSSSSAHLQRPLSALPSYLSPVPSPRSRSPALTLPLMQFVDSRSAPHTPPSPSLKPVRLPSSESARSIRIPVTPEPGRGPFQRGERFEALGLQSGPEVGEQAFLFGTRAELGEMISLDDLPVVEGVLPHVNATVGPEPEVLLRQHELEQGTPPVSEPPLILQRPPLSPVNSFPDPFPGPGDPKATGLAEAKSPSRMKSFSSDKSESPPTEGSSNSTVTPSESPAASPMRITTSTGEVATLAEADDGETVGHEVIMPSLASVPLEMDFGSVPLPGPDIQAASTSSPSPSTGTTASTPSTVHSDHIASSSSTTTSSSTTSSLSFPSSEGTPSSAECETIHTPESAENNEQADEGVISADVPSLEIGIDATRSLQSGALMLGDRCPPFLNPYFPQNPTKTGASSTSESESETPPSRAAEITSGVDTGFSVGQRLQNITSNMGREMEKEAFESETSRPERVPSNEDLQDSAIASTDAAEPEGPTVVVVPPSVSADLAQSSNIPRPDSMLLPPVGSIDSPYPSPSGEPQTSSSESGSYFSVDEPSSRLVTETMPEIREVEVLDEASELPVVRLPHAASSALLEGDMAGDPGHFAQESSGSEEASWIQHESEEGIGYGTDDAAVGRVASMSLVAAVTAAGVLSEQTKGMFTDEVLRVGRDGIYWVRREAAYALGALAKVVPLQVLTLSLLPLYEDMTRDSEWHVRQSALFALPGILARLPADQRTQLAQEQCRSLGHDPERAVRSALLEVMGEVIYCFRDDNGGPPSDLVHLFIGNNEHQDDSWTPPPEEAMRQWGLTTPFQRETPASSFTTSSSGSPTLTLRAMFEEYSDPSSSQFRNRFRDPQMSNDSAEPTTPTRDPERVLICAFNFPAVVAAMGADRWPELRVPYKALTQDPTNKVRRTLGASIGEIARIIGSAHAHTDLMSVWWAMMNDNDNEVRAKVVGCVEMFVAALGEDDRRTVGLQLEAVWNTPLLGWREKEVLASQFGKLTALLATVGRAQSMRTLMTSALTDRVAAVREAAISSIPKYFEGLASQVDVLEAAKEDIRSLASADTYRKRVTYIAVCQALLLAHDCEEDLRSDECHELFSRLSVDNVVDVRIGLSRLIAVICEKYYPELSSRPPWVSTIIQTLSRDSSAEVRSFVGYLLRRPSVATIGSTMSSPSRPSPFATFSRPPFSTSLMDDSLDDLMNVDDLDVEPEDVMMDVDSGPLGSTSSITTGPASTSPSTAALTTPATAEPVSGAQSDEDINPFLHDSQI